MQAMTQESDAIKNRDFDTACFIVFRAAIFTNVVGYCFGRNENIVLNVLPLCGNFLKSAINVAALHRFILHFIACHNFIIAKHSNLNVTDRTGLLVGSIVGSEIKHTLTKPRFRRFVSGGNNQNQQPTRTFAVKVLLNQIHRVLG